jgi:ABC-type Fe3+-siderophore transport system permease subunit
MMRLLVGADYRFLLPASACSGPGSFVGCDAIGRMLLDPTELPWAS